MTVFTSLATGGDIHGGRHPYRHTDAIPMLIWRGFHFNTNGTQSLKLPAYSIIVNYRIIPGFGTNYATAGTVTIQYPGAGTILANGISLTSYADASVSGGPIRVTAEQQIDFVVASLSPAGGATRAPFVDFPVRVAISVMEPPPSRKTPYA